jgi:hypothetical protein
MLQDGSRNARIRSATAGRIYRLEVRAAIPSGQQTVARIVDA